MRRIYFLLPGVELAKVETVEALVSRHHPEADLEGTEPNMPLFP